MARRSAALLSQPLPAALVTLSLIAAAAALGRVLAGDDPFRALDAYRQPAFALPAWGWLVVGIAYYLAMAVILFRLLRRLPASAAAVGLAVAILAANEVWNLLVFGLRAPWAAFAGIVAFAALVAVALLRVRRHDRVASVLLGLYLLWVVAYDVPWSLALALRN